MERYEDRECVILMNEGAKLFAVLHKPLVAGKTPTVMICHGLAGHKTGRYRIYVSLAKELVKAGITVLRLDYRGSGDSEGDFVDMTLDSAVSDVLVGLNYLSRLPTVDPNRIGLIGRSFGGAVAIKAASKFGQIKSLALWAPMFNGHQWTDLFKEAQHEDTDEQRREEILRINGQTMGLPFVQQFFSMSLEKDLQKLQHVPLLHIHGENDHVVTVAHADEYYNSRVNAIAETIHYRLPKADHDFSRAQDQKTAITQTTQWFGRTL